ncbi:MAG: hypothetical protein OXE97_05655 [Gammaproteobacteria bacterium]|nr:hypothetical protein [Gammaproteobacteria bacterium]MCY4210518.1 hypothetical protein [Gammaproteobacteria bacterium]MCY4282396.1 hypothetical protein [Gammaproteobacteria bacterium]
MASTINLCYTYQTMKLNLITTAEDCRRLGIILIAAGLVAGFLEEGQVLSAGLLTGIGLVVSWYGNLEQRK